MYDEGMIFQYELSSVHRVLSKKARILNDDDNLQQQQNLIDIDSILGYIENLTYVKDLNDQLNIEMLQIKTMSNMNGEVQSSKKS